MSINLNDAEFMALSDLEMSHEAFVLYVKCFRRFMNFKTGVVYISASRMARELEVQPKARSSAKPYSPTRQQLRTLITALVKTGLLVHLKAGDIKKGHAAEYLCQLATYGDKYEKISPDQQQPNSNQLEQPLEQPIESHINKGLEAQQQPVQQPVLQSAQQPPTDTTVNNIYKGIDLKIAKEQINEKALKHLIDHRIAKKTAKTQHAFNLQLKQLLRAGEVGMTSEQLIDFTIEADWKAVNIDYTKNKLGNTNNAYQQATPISSKTSHNTKQQVDDFFENPNAQLSALQQAKQHKRW